MEQETLIMMDGITKRNKVGLINCTYETNRTNNFGVDVESMLRMYLKCTALGRLLIHILRIHMR